MRHCFLAAAVQCRAVLGLGHVLSVAEVAVQKQCLRRLSPISMALGPCELNSNVRHLFQQQKIRRRTNAAGRLHQTWA